MRKPIAAKPDQVQFISRGVSEYNVRKANNAIASQIAGRLLRSLQILSGAIKTRTVLIIFRSPVTKIQSNRAEPVGRMVASQYYRPM